MRKAAKPKDHRLKPAEFIRRLLLAGHSTEFIYKHCQRLYAFTAGQRNAINVYRHRLRKAGLLK